MSAKTVEGVRIYKNHDGTLAVFLRHGPNWNCLGTYSTAEEAAHDIRDHQSMITSREFEEL